MNIQNGEIYNARGALEKLTQAKLPLKASYQLAMMATKLSNQIMVIERLRQGLIQKYGEKDPDNPKQIKVDPQGEKFPEFAKEYGELMTFEVEIDFEPVTLPETLEIEPSVLMALDKFITVE